MISITKGKRIEIWLKLPMGFWKGERYHLEYLSTSKGWHWRYLLVCLDKRKDFRWRFQWQIKAIPIILCVIYSDLPAQTIKLIGEK